MHKQFIYIQTKRKENITKTRIDAIWTDEAMAQYISNYNLIDLQENLDINHKSIAIKIDHREWTDRQYIKWKRNANSRQPNI